MCGTVTEYATRRFGDAQRETVAVNGQRFDSRASHCATFWGYGAVGSAQHWQCWGREFEPP